MEEPVPANVVKVTSEYQYQSAPSPRLPPTMVRVLDVPKQVLSFVIVTPVGSVEGTLTVTS